MKILFVAMENSKHTFRWISSLQSEGWSLCLFSSHKIEGLPDPFAGSRAVKIHRTKKHYLDIILHALAKTIKKPRKNLRLLLSLRIHRIVDVDEIERRHRISQLTRIILKERPDIIHTLHTQTSAFLLDEARSRCLKAIAAFPIWIHSTWGSDFFFCGRFPEEREKIKASLLNVDYLLCEGHRDYDIARAWGYDGTALPPLPAFGGMTLPMGPVSVPPSKRKGILVKGYQNTVGRFYVALRSLERCRDLLDGYEIFIFSASNDARAVAALFEIENGIKTNILPYVSEEALEGYYSQCRVFIGLSISDGLPSSFLEAMNRGAFPIQSSTSLAGDYVVNGETAFLVPPNDPDEIEKALRIALTDDALVDEAAIKNRKTMQDRLEYTKVKRQICGMYRDIMGLPPAEVRKPKVGVICVAYNHERFIADALEGFVSQETDFPFEVLVGDDASTDGTAAIIRDYAARYPGIIKPVLRKKNIGATANVLDLLSKIECDYLAICDGDDYWTDTKKLAKQVAFLEDNEEFSICFHPIRQVFTDGSKPPEVIDPYSFYDETIARRGWFTIDELIRMNFIASLSVLYRWDRGTKLPRWFGRHKICDLPLHMLHAARGKIGCLDEVMGVYRRHSGGLWWNNGTNEHKRKYSEDYLALLKDMNKQLMYKYGDSFWPVINWVSKDVIALQGNTLMAFFWKFRRKAYRLLHA